MTRFEGEAMKKWGQILEPACLYAEQGGEDFENLIAFVREYDCRSAVVHGGDLDHVAALPGEKITVVIDFPYGKGGIVVRRAQVDAAFRHRKIRGVDICVNLEDVLNCKWYDIQKDFQELSAIARGLVMGGRSEIKAIIQLPYLWQYARQCIEPLVMVLAKSGVTVIKDWTTVHNFSRPVTVSIEKRLAYLCHLKDVIITNNLLLLIKIAGGVRAENAKQFIAAGADMLGVGVQHVPSVIMALEE